MSRFISAFLMFYLISVGAASAQAYSMVSWTDNGDGIVIANNRTLKAVSPTEITGWTTVVYNGERVEKKLKYGKYLYRFDCAKSSRQLLAFISYDADGKVLDSGNIDPPEVSQVTPNSVSESEQKYMCMTMEERLETPKDEKFWLDINDQFDPIESADYFYKNFKTLTETPAS